jgi:putative membrane protein
MTPQKVKRGEGGARMKPLVRLGIGVSCAVAVAGLPTPARAASAPTSRPPTMVVSQQDRTWMVDFARGNQFEIYSGGLAARRGVRPDTRAVGRRLVSDHTTALAALKQVALRLRVSLPTTLSADQQRELRKLGSLHGIAFDREFLTFEIADHRKVIGATVQETRTGTNPDVKAFARHNLPTLRTHLSLAQHALTELPLTH